MENVAVHQKWDFSFCQGCIEMSHPAVGRLAKGSGLIQLNHADNFPVSVDFQEDGYSLQFESGIGLSMRIECDHNLITMFPVLSNEGIRSVTVGNVEILDTQAFFQVGFSHGFINGKNMVENTGLIPLSNDSLSNSILGLTDNAGMQAFAIGAIRPDDAWYDFSIKMDEGAIHSLKIICRLENTLLAPHTSRTLSPIRLYTGHSLSRLLECYAEDVAEQMVPRNHFKNPMTGWCSWYHYYGTDNIDEVRKNMRSIMTSTMKDRLEVIQIDDGWNRSGHDTERYWGDWFPGSKYPSGMKALADEIHANGFQAGLWLAPFSVESVSQLYKEHPDWLVQAVGGKNEIDPLAAPGGVFGLDLTHPDVQEFIRTTFCRIFKEWGFDYIKIDFLAHGAIEGRRADRSKTGIEAFRIGMQIICEEAGPDKFILNCGSPITASVGLCDGMRIGMDVGGRWFAPMDLKEWRNGNCCLKAAANSTIWRQWMHRVWWHNDPDCIIMRNQLIQIELDTFRRNPLEDVPVREEDFVLSTEETLGWLRLIWMSGGAFIAAEDMSCLSNEQWAALKAMWPLNARTVRWIDDYKHPELGLLSTTSEPLMVGIFNLSDEPRSLCLAAEKIGLPGNWNFVEKLTGETFDGAGETVVFPEIPAHAGRIWTVKKQEHKV